MVSPVFAQVSSRKQAVQKPNLGLLSLNDLIIISKKSFIDADSYLSHKGWRFTEAPEASNNDSTRTATWIVNSSTKNAKLPTAEVALQYRIGQKAHVEYYTVRRDYFDLIKKNIASFQMEEQGSIAQSSGIGSLYYGAKYAVALHISPPTGDTPLYYKVEIDAHGLTKLEVSQDDGSYKSEWRHLIMYGYKSLPESGTTIYSKPDSNSQVLTRVAKGELLIVKHECSECGEDYYKISIHTDSSDSNPMNANFFSVAYILKSEVEYKKLPSED